MEFKLSVFIVCMLIHYGRSHPRCGPLTPHSTASHIFADETSGKCYQLVDNEKHWEESHIYCSNSKGPNGKKGEGELAMFDTPRSLAAVRQWLRQIDWYRNGVWIGARRCHKSPNHFCWVNDEPVSYSLMTDFWGPGEPSSKVHLFFDADCVQIRKGSGWRSYTYPCHTSKFHYSFICQFRKLISIIFVDSKSVISILFSFIAMLPVTTTTSTTQEPTKDSEAAYFVANQNIINTTQSTPTTVVSTTTSTTAAVVTTQEKVGQGSLMALGNDRNSLHTTTSLQHHGVSMLLIGLLAGFGGAMFILVIIILVMWRRHRPAPPVQVVFTPMANGRSDSEEKIVTENEANEIESSKQVELAFHLKRHPSQGSGPKTPPPAYRPTSKMDEPAFMTGTSKQPTGANYKNV